MNPPTPSLPTVTLSDRTAVPALGMGTWKMGEQRGQAKREIAALAHGVDLGMTLIDTAEMYGDGGAEKIVGQAIAGRRDEVFIVSKVYPHNAGARSAAAACERSLKRLATDRIDLYLLHWRGSIPLGETVVAFERLVAEGKILRWGVSNFAVDDIDELLRLPEGPRCATNQVLYNLTERGIEWRLLNRCRRHDIPIMAYSPVGQGALLKHRKLAALATSLSVKLLVTPAQLALAWTLAQAQVIAIPQSSNSAHISENRTAANLKLDAATLAALDAAFPPPAGPTRLATN
ncbi:MAG: aldo/keto reductase [Betaproteobacteria bacterium]|nr:aldo/keto reductase [Betaproteobacteria bacterium]